MAAPPVLWDIESDPVLANVKLIAEAWDAAGLYQVGSFVGESWKEWNGRFRDDVRAFVKGDARTVRTLASRLLGSPDLYEHEQREPEQSINFVTCHDGFTLGDLVSYDRKHNEANGESNRDGADDNRSWNCGAEGPSDDAAIETLRNRQVKNFLALLLCGVGTPMLLMGDEVRRTQRGNNNAYCQDNDTSWYDWAHADETLLAFTRDLIRLRSAHPVFCRRRWFQGRPIFGTGVSDIGWFTPAGSEMSDQDWQAGFAKSLGVFLNGDAVSMLDEHGQRIVDDSFYVMLNAHSEPVEFVLPESKWGEQWSVAIDTSELPDGMDVEAHRPQLAAGEHVHVQAWSMVLLRRFAAGRT